MQLTSIESIADPGEAAVMVALSNSDGSKFFYSSSYFEMSIWQYFTTSPSREGTTIGAVATREMNESVERALAERASQQKARKLLVLKLLPWATGSLDQKEETMAVHRWSHVVCYDMSKQHRKGTCPFGSRNKQRVFTACS